MDKIKFLIKNTNTEVTIYDEPIPVRQLNNPLLKKMEFENFK